MTKGSCDADEWLSGTTCSDSRGGNERAPNITTNARGLVIPEHRHQTLTEWKHGCENVTGVAWTALCSDYNQVTNKIITNNKNTHTHTH